MGSNLSASKDGLGTTPINKKLKLMAYDGYGNDKNTAEQLRKAIEPKAGDKASIELILENQINNYQLDPETVHVILCSNAKFNTNDGLEDLKKLMAAAAKQNQGDVVIFLVEKTLYSKKGIKDVFRQNDKNIAFIKIEWEENGINSMNAQNIAQQIFDVLKAN